MLPRLMEQLNKELELSPALAPDAKGRYQMPFSEGLSVIIADLTPGPGIGLYCEVAKSPTKGEEALFQEMMLANLFGQGTQGAVLGTTSDGKTLTLSLEIDYNIEYKDFRDLLEDFLNAADFWRDEAAKLS